MEFKSGMLGCAIVMVVLACSVFGTILISADETTHNVTKYRYETDITGLFPVDTSPEYMDYNLAKNYTGYYTDDTIIDGTEYWGGATYTSTGVNNYPIKYAPNIVSSIETISPENVSEIENSSIVPYTYSGITWCGRPYGDLPYSVAAQSYTKTLTSLISTLNLNLTGYQIIEITSIPSIVSSTNIKDCLFFGTNGDFGTDRPGHQTQVISACYVDQNVYSTYPSDTIYFIACYSCKIDMVTRNVDLYYNNSIDNTSYVKTISLDDAVVSFTSTGVSDEDNLKFNVSRYTNVTDYMDISKGVTVTGVTA